MPSTTRYDSEPAEDSAANGEAIHQPLLPEKVLLLFLKLSDVHQLAVEKFVSFRSGKFTTSPDHYWFHLNILLLARLCTMRQHTCIKRHAYLCDGSLRDDR